MPTCNGFCARQTMLGDPPCPGVCLGSRSNQEDPMAVTPPSITVDVKVEGPVIDLLRQAADEIVRLRAGLYRVGRATTPEATWYREFARCVLVGMSIDRAGSCAAMAATEAAQQRDPAPDLTERLLAVAQQAEDAAHRGGKPPYRLDEDTPQEPPSAPHVPPGR